MGEEDIPRHVRQFILERVDSVELLEVLLLLRARQDKEWTAETASAELRTHPTSVGKRLAYIKKLGLVAESEKEPGLFRYAPQSEASKELIDGLAETYRVRRTAVLEMIFSPMRKAIDLASAFNISKGEDHG